MEIPTVINSGSKMNGELMFTSDVRIDGEVIGKVDTERSAVLGAGGFVKGLVRARDLVVYGRIEGNIIVSGSTILHSGASIYGNLYTRILEVKEGAQLTARVIPYDKLEATDEAQIYLAEEMIKLHSGRRNAPIQTKVQISFEDNLESDLNSSDEITLLGGYKDTTDIPADSDDLLPQILDEKELSDNELVGGGSVSVTEVFIDESLSSPFAMDEVNSDILQSGINEMEDNILRVFAFESQIIQQAQLPDLLSSPETESGELEDQKLSANFDTENYSELTGEILQDPHKKSFSIAPSLSQPVKEEIHTSMIGKEEIFKPDSSIPSQTVRQAEERVGISFKKLKNLLIHDRHSNVSQVEKKSGQIEYNPTKLTENDDKKLIKETDKILSINDAISQLPPDDYSSLFN